MIHTIPFIISLSFCVACGISRCDVCFLDDDNVARCKWCDEGFRKIAHDTACVRKYNGVC